MIHENNRPLIIAHRGARDLAPENTIKACQLALENGSNALELDIRLCKSGELVLYHDAFLYKHFGEMRPFAGATLDHLRTLEFNKRHYQYPAGINTLEELLEEFKNKIPINLEAKILFQDKRRFIEQLVKLIDKFNLKDQVWISSFNPTFLKALKSYTKKVKTGLLFRHLSTLYKSLDHVLLSDAWHPHFSLCTKGFIKSARKLNKEIYLWTLKKERDLKNVPLQHVQGIITDMYDHKFEK